MKANLFNKKLPGLNLFWIVELGNFEIAFSLMTVLPALNLCNMEEIHIETDFPIPQSSISKYITGRSYPIKPSPSCKKTRSYNRRYAG